MILRPDGSCLRAICFDFDGTLADTEPLHFIAARETLARHGVALTKSDYFGRYFSFCDAELLATALADLSALEQLPRVEDLVEEKARAMELLISQKVTLHPGAQALIEEAVNIDLTLAIVSGARRHEIEAILDQHGLRQHFAAIVSADDTQQGKPDPEGYTRALRALGTIHPRDALAVEDSAKGVAAARAAGIPVTAVTHSQSVAELSDADQVIETLARIDLFR